MHIVFGCYCQIDSVVVPSHEVFTGRTHKSGPALTAASLLFAYRRPSVTPRIHRRLTHHVATSHRRHRPGQLDSPGNLSSTGHRRYRQLAVGDLVDDSLDRILVVTKPLFGYI